MTDICNPFISSFWWSNIYVHFWHYKIIMKGDMINVLLESLFLNAGFCIFILSNQKNMTVYSHFVCCQSLHPEYPKLIFCHNLLWYRHECLTVVNIKTSFGGCGAMWSGRQLPTLPNRLYDITSICFIII